MAYIFKCGFSRQSEKERKRKQEGKEGRAKVRVETRWIFDLLVVCMDSFGPSESSSEMKRNKSQCIEVVTTSKPEYTIYAFVCSIPSFVRSYRVSRSTCEDQPKWFAHIEWVTLPWYASYQKILIMV